MTPQPLTASVLGHGDAAGLEARARELLDPFPVAVYLAQGMYFFEGAPGRKIKATYAASVAGDDLEPIFDACLKTLWPQEEFAALVGELKPKTMTR